jgi:hypothetical protein
VRVGAWQLAPRCRFLGRFVLRAGRGTNLLVVPRRIGTHRLRAGTYHFVGLSHGTQVLDVSFRLVRRKQHLRLRRHHLVDVCTAATALEATAQTFGAGLPFAIGGPPSALPASTPTAVGPTTTHVVHRHAPFLPPLLRDLNPADASPFVRAVFFALLGCAILFLAAATLPEQAAAAAGGPFVTRHRAHITMGGLALLAAAAFLLGFL